MKTAWNSMPAPRRLRSTTWPPRSPSAAPPRWPKGAYSLTLGAITDPGPDTVTQWIVHWGDGQTSTFTSGGVQTHAYADGPAGPFNITVDLTDEDGTFLNRANALAVSVTNVPSTIALTGNATANEGTPYSLTLGATDPGTDTVTATPFTGEMARTPARSPAIPTARSLRTPTPMAP